jgi:hypothetical protein
MTASPSASVSTSAHPTRCAAPGPCTEGRLHGRQVILTSGTAGAPKGGPQQPCPDRPGGHDGDAAAGARGGPRIGRDGLLATGDIGHWDSHLANYEVPRSVSFLDELPRNATGKVLKRELRELGR